MKKSASTAVIVLLSILLGAAVVGGIVWGRDDGGTKRATVSTTSQNVSQTQPQTQTSAPALTTSDDFSSLYERVRPSIVRITTGGTTTTNPFGQNQQEGLGSGIVLDTNGDILTNYHVVTGFTTVTVTFSDDSVAQAEVVGKDPGNDMAVVKTASGLKALKPATLGDSSTVKVGSVVAAVGNPFGLDGSFTTGVISGLNRTLSSSANGRPIRGLLQTDAAVNPGNSGGGLFNTAGEVIGINTAIENPNGSGFAGVAYAVPINTPKRFLDQLTAGKTITHARLGISGKSLTADEAKQLGVSQGVAVVQVQAGSSADQAGLKSSAAGTGDVITEIDGQPMATFEALADYIDGKQVGDQVKVTVRRNGSDTTLTVTLKSWDSSA